MWEVFVSLVGRMIQHMAGFDFMKNEPNTIQDPSNNVNKCSCLWSETGGHYVLMYFLIRLNNISISFLAKLVRNEQTWS